MKKKVVWIVNEYNFPNAIKSRQTNLCRQLTLSGYDAYIVSGSVENKSGRNVLFKNEKFRFVETDEAKGYLINTSSYRRNFERVLVALQFQRRLWNLRNELPMPDVIVSDFAGLFGNIFLKWKKKYGTKVIYDILDLWPEGFVDMGYLKKILSSLKYFMVWNINPIVKRMVSSSHSRVVEIILLIRDGAKKLVAMLIQVISVI